MTAEDGDGGRLDLLGYARPEAAGLGLDYAQRLGAGASAFARAWAGTRLDPRAGWQGDYGAQAGIHFFW